MEYKSKKSGKARVMRFLGRAVPAVLAVGVLAACGGGGGSGGDGNVSVQPCNSQNSRGDGYAIGSCAATTTNVLQPIEAAVAVNGVDAYTLTLDFPPDLSSLDSVTGFTSANKPPDALRNIIGIMEGQAYENPMTGKNLLPPYVAITDFFQATNYENKEVQPSLKYASFGTWEKFAGAGLEGFNEGYLGVWYAERPAPPVIVPDAPLVAATYKGRAVGIVGVANAGAPDFLKQIGGRFGFSAPITIQVSGSRIESARINDLTISWQQAGATLNVAELDLNPLVFGESTTPPGLLAGAVASDPAGSISGKYEARYFGSASDHATEIAGRFRFTTSNGLVGVASFGAIRQ
ncbi:MAG: hypothetical protein LT102_16145 [Burkholderiaceae bacterium]|nr:hypothetical protein [Burkholderiaceae bacterium]